MISSVAPTRSVDLLRVRLFISLITKFKVCNDFSLSISNMRCISDETASIPLLLTLFALGEGGGGAKWPIARFSPKKHRNRSTNVYGSL